MTKDQLIKALEPFDDDISIWITVPQAENYFASPRIFYRMSSDGDGQILIAANHPGGERKIVELKV